MWGFMKRKVWIPMTLVCTSLLLHLPSVAVASEAIPDGAIDRLSYRAEYVLFQVKNGVVNSCASCNGDPAGYYSGTFCWVPTSRKTLVAMILSAQAQGAKVRTRVMSWAQCEVYQFEILEQ